VEKSPLAKTNMQHTNPHYIPRYLQEKRDSRTAAFLSELKANLTKTSTT